MSLLFGTRRFAGGRAASRYLFSGLGDSGLLQSSSGPASSLIARPSKIVKAAESSATKPGITGDASGFIPMAMTKTESVTLAVWTNAQKPSSLMSRIRSRFNFPVVRGYPWRLTGLVWSWVP